VHERQHQRFNRLAERARARKMVVAITCGDRSALTNLYMDYYGCLAHFLSQFMGSDTALRTSLMTPL